MTRKDCTGFDKVKDEVNHDMGMSLRRQIACFEEV